VAAQTQPAAGKSRTRAATDAHMQNAALRAVDDPAELAKAARVVRAALARRVLTPADLRGPIVKDEAAAGGPR
jgi:hypothetical protein